MRTSDELVAAALVARRKAINDGGPFPEFPISPHERCVLMNEKLEWQQMAGLPETFFGLKVTLPSEQRRS